MSTRTSVSVLAWSSRLEFEEIHAAAAVDPRDAASVAIRHDATVFCDQYVASIFALDPLSQRGHQHLDLHVREFNAGPSNSLLGHFFIAAAIVLPVRGRLAICFLSTASRSASQVMSALAFGFLR